MAKKKAKSKAKQPPKVSIPEDITSEVIAAAYNSVPQPVFMKVCRLCESKDGPFLNIFDADKVTAKKIDELMPFGIAENDDLPHKICFRCSAKLEELYEFIQKCIKTQESLRTAIGKTGPFITKTKTRKAWEEKLNKTNMSNDDICDALIKKAMEGIKDMPLKPLPEEVEKENSPSPSPAPVKRVTRRNDQPVTKRESTSDDNDDSDNNLKQVKSIEDSCNAKITRPSKANVSNIIEPPPTSSNKKPQIAKRTKEMESSTKKNNISINSLSFDFEEEKSSVKDEKKTAEKPFNIMDHISMIKVNGVGVLFQCKLCNRNFLKKEVVESHNCAKNGIPKVEVPKEVPVPEPPKVSTVKYIKIDGDMKKPLSWKSYKFDNDNVSSDKISIPSKDNNKFTDDSNSSDNNLRHEEPKPKPKPKAGPASKTRRIESNADPGPSQKTTDSQESQLPNASSPSVQIPSLPNLNGRFKLVPGPNNIFTLVEEATTVPNPDPVIETQKSNRKRKSDTDVETKSKDRKKDDHTIPEVIDVDYQTKPYPVGLFQTGGHNPRIFEPPVPPPAPFTTPAMKKQSYTIVQTGNPSKLLISTKAQAPSVEVPKKRQRKSKLETREDTETKEPFRVTLEDVAHPKDSGFFTFINVDPLLQPSYVLPTDNIIQESQISTSSAIHSAQESSSKEKDKYSCNMCGENFSREKKLLAHIQSHYTKMDEEDQLRAEKTSKKKGKK